MVCHIYKRRALDFTINKLGLNLIYEAYLLDLHSSIIMAFRGWRVRGHDYVSYIGKHVYMIFEHSLNATMLLLLSVESYFEWFH